MWAILNIDIKKKNFFEVEFKNRVGSDFKIYYPKLKIKTYKNKIFSIKSIPLLGNYIFCFHNKFNSQAFIQNIKFIKGLNYILTDFKYNQVDIINFIDSCKKNEDENGYLIQDFLSMSLNKYYKFRSGLLANRIFRLINLQRNKIKVLINDLKFEVNKKDLLILPNN